MRLNIELSRKGFTINRQPGQEISSITALMPRTGFDFAGEVNGYQSAIIMACIRWIQRTFPEAPLMLEKQSPDGSWDRIHGHPALRLMDMPNTFYDGLLLEMGLIADYILTGNAYVYKRRSAANRVVELWWLPSVMVEPKWPMDNSIWLSHYEYYSTAHGVAKIPPEDMIHFRDGFDPNNLRKGLSPLKALFREVFTDDEAANMTASLLRNLGVPGLLVSPDKGMSVSKEDADATKEWLKDRFTGDRRGEPLVMSSATKVETFGFNPEQMGMRDLRKIPEERITAVIGVPAIVAGLGAGLDRSTYSNYAEAREAAYEGTILPLQRITGSVWKRQLLDEYEDDLLAWRVGYDISGVRILQEDDNKKVERINNMVQGGYIKVRDAQEMAKVPIDDTQDYYIRPFNVIAVSSGPAAPMPPATEPEEPEHPAKELKYSLDEMGKETRWRAYVLKAERFENQFIADLRKMFSKQSKEAVRNLKSGKDTLISQIQAKDDYIEAAFPILSELMAKEIEDAQNLLNGHKEMKQDFEGLSNQAAILWLRTRMGWAAEAIGEETAHLLAMQLSEGYAAGESIPQLTKRVKQVFVFSSDVRAKRIARTETIQAAAQGAIEGYKEAGVGRVEFYAALDERTCPDCLALHGQEFPVHESTGMITVHPGCRCTWLPVVI